MFASKTVLILGAGSSVGFGMPLGSTLKTEIMGLLEFSDGPDLAGDRQMVAALRALYPDDDTEIRRIAQVARAALPYFNSIDDFLSTHGEDERVSRIGKLAIARAISSHETSSPVKRLWADEEFEDGIAAINGSWPQTLATIACTGVKSKDYLGAYDDLSIINFNYDRCAESILRALLRPIFNINASEAAEAMSRVPVFRPYGGLGDLPDAGTPGAEFGGLEPDLVAMSEKIRVYTEDPGERPDLLEMRQALAGTGCVIFLGFGFHTQNVDILAIGDGQAPGKVLATITNEPLPARAVISASIARALRYNGATLGNAHENCESFVSEQRRIIAR